MNGNAANKPLKDRLLTKSMPNADESERGYEFRERDFTTIPLNNQCKLLEPKEQSRISKLFADRNITVDCLSILFGLGAWLCVNSVFLQLPLLINTAPESWSLPSYMVIFVQLGNIGPFIYTIIQKYSTKKLIDAHIIYFLLATGTVASITFAFTYQHIAFIGGQYRSVVILAMTWIFALVGCTSSVLFMPYMGRFREMYLIAYLTGEGLSGFLNSILALIQGVGGNVECIFINSTIPGVPEWTQYTPPPRFDTQTFFIIIFVLMLMSCIGFFLLDKLKKCRQEYAAVRITHGNKYQYDKSENKEEKFEMGNIITEPDTKLSTANYNYLLFLIGTVCLFANGIFPAIQSYSCLPYGNITYHVTVALSSMANPIACFLAFFLPHTSIRNITLLAVISAILGMYTTATAVLSPTPPLVGLAVGEGLVILSWTILIGLISYIRLSITTVLRSRGGKSLVWVGIFTQSGSFIGAIIALLLVTHTSLFVSYQPCNQ